MTQVSLTLFCFPCSGASAAGYLRWRRFVPNWLNIRPVELPGRGSRTSEPLSYAFDPLVQQLTDDIALDLPEKYAFFGHSFGGLLAYGCAHQLGRRALHPPLALVAACSAAPSKRDDERLGKLSSDTELTEELRKLNGTPPELFEHPELLRMTLDVLAADYSVCASFRYVAPDPLETSIFVFGGRDDDVEEDELEAWRIETLGPTSLEMFDGGHFFIKEHERAFLSRLQEKLHGLTSSIAHCSIERS